MHKTHRRHIKSAKYAVLIAVLRKIEAFRRVHAVNL